jgi:predicted O-methyltransferase YrrM
MQWGEARVQIQAIEGLISEAEAECLFKLARNCNGTIVEIGSWKGKSTVCLALGSKAGGKGKVFAIDPHQGLCNEITGQYTPDNTEPIFRENIKQAQVDDIVIPLVMKSEEAARGWTEPIFLLWIDGAHDYENVKLDFTLWEPHLISGGIISFHDAFYSFGCPWRTLHGIKKIVINNILKSNKFSKVKFCDSMVYATKVAELSVEDRVLNCLKLLLYHILLLVWFPLITLIVQILVKTRLLRPAKLIKDKVLALIKLRGD